MKVTLSLSGRFHGFDLAAQLEKRGVLERLITSYPKFALAKYGIPPAKIRSILEKELLHRLFFYYLPPALGGGHTLEFALNEYFDRRAARYVPADTDLFVGFSNFSLRGIARAKELGAKTIVEHGSSHIAYQHDILMEEYARFDAPAPYFDPRSVEKGMREYALADAIAIPSLFAKRTFIEQGIPAEKLIHVPYGVNLGSFREFPKEDDVFRVIFVGGMSLRKGVHYLLQAFAELALPNSELLLVGSMNPEIQPFFKKYDGTFRYIGHVPQAELHRHYSQSSVFVLNSIEDGFGMVLSQAMACGLPIIATENTGAPDVVEEGKSGFIIPIRSVDALKEKLTYLYEHPAERAAMGKAAAAKMAHGFTWDDYGERMVGEYRKLLGR